MRVDWKGLIQGMYNAAVGKSWIKDLAVFRYDKYCKACEFNSTMAREAGTYSSIRPDEHCTACGCNLEWKTHQLSSSCPKSKWMAEVSEEEARQLTAKMSETAKTS